MLKDRLIKILSKNFTPIHIAVLLSIASASSVFGTPRETVVYPTGNFPQDVQNVQAAVDAGGRVRLKAVDINGQPTAFNFGTPQNLPGRRVLIRNNVTIYGERNGQNMTTIRGGNVPLRTILAVTTSISDIYFNGPRGSAIRISFSTGVTITGNRISGVVGALNGLGFTFGDGIDVFGYQDRQHRITGKVSITSNIIENLHADFANGIQVDGVAGESEILDNIIRDVETAGITVIRSGSSTTIERNIIIPGAGNGTALFSYGVGIDFSGANYSVRHNSIRCDNPLGEGIYVIGGGFADATSGAVIESNTVSMNGSDYDGVALYGLVDHTLVTGNTISGDAAFAIVDAEGPEPTDISNFNTFRGNNLSHFTSSIADVFFSSNTANNKYLGECRSALDLGVNNQLTCGGEHQMFTLSRKSIRPFSKIHPQILNSALTVPLDDDTE